MIGLYQSVTGLVHPQVGGTIDAGSVFVNIIIEDYWEGTLLLP